MKTPAKACLLSLVVLFLSCKSAVRTDLHKNPSEILVAAHRAYHTQAPENSLAAIDSAIRNKVDIIEIDVRISKDGIPFILHDQKLDRTTTGKGDIEQWSSEELKKLFLKHADSVTAQRIPTLEEVLVFSRGRALFDLDMKTDQVDMVLDVVKKHAHFSDVIFFDSDTVVLNTIRRDNRKWMIMPRIYRAEDVVPMLKRYEPVIVHIDPKTNTKEVCDLIKAGGARIWINALGLTDLQLLKGQTAGLNELTKNGANVIQTDHPVLLKKKLKVHVTSE